MLSVPIQLDSELFKEKTLQLLADVGVKIESDELVSIMLEKGCTEGPDGRVRIPAGLIEELVATQEKTRSADDDDQQLHPWCGVDWTHWLTWTDQKEPMRERLQTEFLMSAFDCGPTHYYDYPAGEAVAVNTDILVEMMKFAEATPEIGYISTWYRQDVPQPTERLASLILALQYTTKVDGIESIDPSVIKYLVEIGEIMTGKPKSACYLAGSECMISPLILDHRAAADMLERNRLGINRYHMASMPTVGIATPVTLAAAVTISVAEILGGLVAAYCLAPEGDLTGRIICTVMDMRTANTSPAGPENLMVNLAVKKLFDDCFGGHLWSEIFFSPSTHHPGLQAVYENFYAASAVAQLSGSSFIPYPGMGTLANGGMGSPTQFMLDMEIRKSQFQVKERIAITEDTLPFAEMCECIAAGGNFLESDHTLTHFRELWRSELFPPSPSAETRAVGDEKRILDECEERWRANVAVWQPPEWPADTTKALEGLLRRAEKELL